MRAFEHIHAKSFEDAATMLAQSPGTDVMAGGTDKLDVYKNALLETHPEKVVSLKAIPNAEGIEEKDGKITVKAMTRLTQLGEDVGIAKHATALSQAARSVATPLIRNLATIGGNICQDVRCWYYRYPHEVGGRLDCSRKGGDTCYAIQGENRYHSIFGGMKTQAAPCVKGCPAATDIPGYMSLLRAGDMDGAAERILSANPMPMVTARICPHPCQDNCNQCSYGDSVGIHCVERTIGDYILENAAKFYSEPQKKTGKKAGIVGAGPGGLAAAYYLRKAGHDVTVIDVHEKAGGVLMYGIPHYRLPKEIVQGFVDALAGMGIKFDLGVQVGKDISIDELLSRFDNIYLGTGAWKQPMLGIRGEDLTEFGLNFLVEVNTFLKKSVSEDVLVCGGGNVAMDVALTAKRLGAKNVRLVCLEQEDEMPAASEEIARAKEEGVEIFNGWGLKGVVTDANGKATGLESMRCVSVFDENGRFAPKYDESDITTYSAQNIILATGQRVDTGFLGEKFSGQLQSKRGLLEVDPETFQTSNERIFAGGDAVTGPDIAIGAIKAGSAAARAMSRQLGTDIQQKEVEQGQFLTYDIDGVEQHKGAKLNELPVDKRTLTDEDASSLTIEEAQNEASRCMNCGCYSVSASDIAPALMALSGSVITTKKEIPAKNFFTTKLKSYDMLDSDELVTAINVPVHEGYTSGYEKIRIRTSIDFALVGMAYAYKLEGSTIGDIRIILSGVAPVPVELTAVEEFLKGKTPSDGIAKEAGELAIKDASPMSKNDYKCLQVKASIERLIASL